MTNHIKYNHKVIKVIVTNIPELIRELQINET